MKRWGSLVIVVLVISLGVLGSGCLGGNTGGGGGGGTTGNVKIGVILPLTGSLNSIAEVIKEGIDLAASDINAAGGINGKTVSLIYKDDRLDGPTGTQVYQELIGEKVKGIVGPIPSTITLQVINANEQKSESSRVVIVSPASTATELSGKSQYFFRTVPSDAIQGPDAANVMVNTLQKKIGLLYQNDIYGNGLREEFKAKLATLGGEIVAEEAFQIGQTSFGAQTNKIISANPEAVFIPGFYMEISLAIKELRSQGYTGVIVASEAIENRDIFQIGGSALNDILFMKASVESTRPTYAKFLENYSKKYGGKPGAYADYGYDALLVIVETLRAKGISASSAEIKDYMHQTTFTTTVTRDIRFDSNGDLIGGGYALYKIKCNDASCTSGEFVPYG